MAQWALITGAAGGIGQSLCQVFQQAGYSILGLDIEAHSLSDICDASLACDLQRYCYDESYRQTVLGQVRSVLGEARLQVLINNAAVQIVKPSESLTFADWQQTLSVNLVAPFLLTQGLLPELEAASGSVINIASIHATLTKPQFVCYATSKSALVGLTRSMAVDLGGRIRVNAIAPAAVATPMLVAGFEGNVAALEQLAKMHPADRIAEPEEVAQAALFLASHRATFMTGTVLELDGGISGRLHDPV